MGRLRRAAHGVAAAAAGLVLVLLAVIALAVDGEAAVPAPAEVTPADVARSVALLRAQDPRRAPAGAMRLVQLGEGDLELLSNHGAHRWLGARVRVRLEAGRARLQASGTLPAGRWLNLDLELVERAGWPEIVSARLGRLPLPAALARPLLRTLFAHQPGGPDLLSAAAMVRRISFAPRRLIIAYTWDPEATRRAIASLVTADDASRLRAYQERLARIAEAWPATEPVALSALLAPLAELAQTRSGTGEDPAAENRALLLLLALHVNGRDPGRLLPQARDWPPMRELHIVLDGRGDLAQHFLVSAAIAIDGTSPLSRAVGVYKEMADARRGSGFSFNDLAADRAGTRLGELALEQPVQTQARLRSLTEDRALMPRWNDLPEFLPEAEFRRRFGGVGAPAYERLLAEIDQRVAALDALR